MKTQSPIKTSSFISKVGRRILHENQLSFDFQKQSPANKILLNDSIFDQDLIQKPKQKQSPKPSKFKTRANRSPIKKEPLVTNYDKSLLPQQTVSVNLPLGSAQDNPTFLVKINQQHSVTKSINQSNQKVYENQNFIDPEVIESVLQPIVGLEHLIKDTPEEKMQKFMLKSHTPKQKYKNCGKLRKLMTTQKSGIPNNFGSKDCVYEQLQNKINEELHDQREQGMYEKYPGGYEQTIMELRQEIYAYRNKKMAKLI